MSSSEKSTHETKSDILRTSSAHSNISKAKHNQVLAVDIFKNIYKLIMQWNKIFSLIKAWAINNARVYSAATNPKLRTPGSNFL